MSLPNRVYGVLRAEVKEKVFSDSISMFSEMPVDIQVKNGQAVLLRYNNEGEVDENNVGYEEKRDLKDTDWKIIYRIDNSYFSSAFHPRIIGSVVIVVLLLLLGFIGVNKSARSLLHYLYQIIDHVKKVKDGNFEIQIAESSQDEIGELARNINKMLRKIQTLIDEVYKSKLDKKSLELDLLQSKINPHFLFNMLNNANVLIKRNPEEASKVLFKLEDLLRYQINDSSRERVSLASDICFLNDYLNLEKIRRDNFQFTLRQEGEVDSIWIQPLLFIPFVENAVKHSFDSEHSSYVHVFFKVDAHRLDFRCENSKPVVAVRQGKVGGIGLANIQRRLGLLYPEHYKLEQREDENLYSVILSITL